MFRCMVFLALASCALVRPAGAAWELWRTTTEGDVWDLAATGDLDGDSVAEVLAGAADNTVRALSGSDGHVLWSFGAEGDVWCVAPFPDLDGDGKRDVVAGTGGNEVLVLSAAGKLLWSYAAAGDVWSLSEAGDTNADGSPELAVGAGDNKVHLLDLRGKKSLWTKDLGGDIWSLAGGWDIDGDSVPDVVAGTGADTVVALGGASGSTIWTHTALGDVWCVLVTQDVDGDGVRDVVAGTAANRVLCLPGKPRGGPGGPGPGGGFIWQSPAGSDVRVLAPAPDRDGDGIDEILAGGLDDTARLLRGKTGDELWTKTVVGAVKDAIIGPDIDHDGLADVIVATDGGAVDALSGAGGSSLWTYSAAVDATFWSLCALPDLDGDGLQDIATGSALNEVVALRAAPEPLVESVSDLACVAAEAAAGPGVLLTWVDPPLATSVRIFEATVPTSTLVGEVAAGVQRILVPVTGDVDPRDYSAIPVGQAGEGAPEGCTVTLAPPPVTDLECLVDASGTVTATWRVPDPGLRQLDGIRVTLDGSLLKVLESTASSTVLGKPEPGLHTVVVTTIWTPWDSPPFTCIVEVPEPGNSAYIRADADASGALEITDAIATLMYLFGGHELPCLAALDSNRDGKADISDPVYSLRFLFLGGDPPESPYPLCGFTAALPCASFPACQ